jgi:hypothetical protein
MKYSYAPSGEISVDASRLDSKTIIFVFFKATEQLCAMDECKIFGNEAFCGYFTDSAGKTSFFHKKSQHRQKITVFFGAPLNIKFIYSQISHDYPPASNT